MSVPFLDLKVQHEALREEILDVVDRVLVSCRFSLGPEVALFEEAFSAYCGTKFGVAVNSGTSALHLALLACEVGEGDEVITVANTFFATVEAILYTGAKPVFVDISSDDCNIDVELIEDAITPKTKAIIPVHLYGYPARMREIARIAVPRSIRVIEDAAQAHGAVIDVDRAHIRAGAWSDVGCFSFYPSKNLGACGEGGIAVTNDSDIAESIEILRDHGQVAKYRHNYTGFNYRMDAIQGAILRAKLNYLPAWSADRRRIAHRYSSMLSISHVRTPAEAEGIEPVYHIYAIRTPFRQELIREFKVRDIGYGLHYPVPIHQQKGLTEGRYTSLERTEKHCAETISLPIFPEMTDAQIEEVVECVRDVHRRV